MTLPAKLAPSRKRKTYVSYMFLERRQPIMHVIIKRFPIRTIGFLPYGLSAKAGTRMMVVHSPAKNMEPKRPIFSFGSHSKSSLSALTQLSIYSGSDVTGL